MFPLILIFVLLTPPFLGGAQQPSAAESPGFAGKYSQLDPAQRRLVDDWFRRFSEAINKPVAAEEGYDNLPLSVKTTFNAVTHALRQTPLTDASGAQLGETAISIIDKLDNVAGKVPGAGGDEQFRIYVQLKSETLDILKKSKEFKRGPDNAQFVLYDVREDLAEQFNCVNQLDPGAISPKAARSQAFGKYVGAVFRLKAGRETGETVVTVWAKEGGYWKLISYDVEPELEKYRIPNLTPAAVAAAPGPTYVQGDPGLIRAGVDFLDKWFIRGQVDQAFEYLSASCYPCLNLYRSEGTPEPQTLDEAGRMIRQGMERIGGIAGKAQKLQDAIAAPQPEHPDIRLVKHAASKAFVVASMPDYMAETVDCTKRKPGEEPDFQQPGTKKYGDYYAIGFRLAATAGDAGVFWTVWHREAGAWKITSYLVLTP